MKNKIMALLLCLTVAGVGCKKDTQAEAPVSNDNPQPTSAVSISANFYNQLADHCDSYDLIFNDYPVSMAGNDNAACKHVLMLVSPEVGQIDSRSRSLGKFILKNGFDDLVYADIYFDDYTQAMQFTDPNDGQVYVNQLSERGKQFFTQTLQNLQSGSPAQ